MFAAIDVRGTSSVFADGALHKKHNSSEKYRNA